MPDSLLPQSAVCPRLSVLPPAPIRDAEFDARHAQTLLEIEDEFSAANRSGLQEFRAHVKITLLLIGFFAIPAHIRDLVLAAIAIWVVYGGDVT